MKHRVTIEMETKKHLLGIPFKVKEKRHIMVDGKTYREIKRKVQWQRQKSGPTDDEVAAAALIVFEEEMVDLFGE